MTSHVERVSLFKKFLIIQNPLKPEYVDLVEFRRQCFLGIPDEPGMRATCWKLLLGYLPLDKQLWEAQLFERRSNYLELVREKRAEDDQLYQQIRRDARRTLPAFSLFQSPVRESPLSPLTASRPMSPSSSIFNPDHEDMPDFYNCHSRATSMGDCFSPPLPEQNIMSCLAFDDEHQPAKDCSLSTSLTSVHTDNYSENFVNIPWPPAYEDGSSFAAYLLKDEGKPPATAMGFNHGTTRSAKQALKLRQSSELMTNRPQTSPLLSSNYRSDMHWEVVERILFMYAKLNPLVGYVQGMNCLIAPIYWLFANDPDLMNQAHAEADAFFCFSALMSDARDLFLNSMDCDRQSGIHATLSRLETSLERCDPELCANLKRKNLQPQFYAFRWYMCLSAAEWPLPEVFRVWDSLLSDPSRHTTNNNTGWPFLTDLCCAMLLCVRDQLIQEGFDNNIKLLQDYPADNFDKVLRKAHQLWQHRQRYPSNAWSWVNKMPKVWKWSANASNRLMGGLRLTK